MAKKNAIATLTGPATPLSNEGVRDVHFPLSRIVPDYTLNARGLNADGEYDGHADLCEKMRMNGIIDDLILFETDAKNDAGETMCLLGAGYRRFRAAVAIGLTEAPVIIKPKTENLMDIYRVNLLENDKESLHPHDVAKRAAEIQVKYKLSGADIYEQLPIGNRNHINNLLRWYKTVCDKVKVLWAQHHPACTHARLEATCKFKTADEQWDYFSKDAGMAPIDDDAGSGDGNGNGDGGGGGNDDNKPARRPATAKVIEMMAIVKASDLDAATKKICRNLLLFATGDLAYDDCAALFPAKAKGRGRGGAAATA